MFALKNARREGAFLAHTNSIVSKAFLIATASVTIAATVFVRRSVGLHLF